MLLGVLVWSCWYFSACIYFDDPWNEQKWLVGGLEHEFYDFPFSWEFHNLNWLSPSRFFRGVGSPHQMIIPRYPLASGTHVHRKNNLNMNIMNDKVMPVKNTCWWCWWVLVFSTRAVDGRSFSTTARLKKNCPRGSVSSPLQVWFATVFDFLSLLYFLRVF